MNANRHVCCALAAVSVAVGLAANSYGQPGSAPPPVVVAELIERDVTIGQSFVGTVLPRRRSVVGSAVDGRVLKLHVDEGDEVKMVTEADTTGESGEPRHKGQPLAQLRTQTLDIQIEAAKRELDAREKELDKWKLALPQQIKQAKAKLAGADALVKYAESKYKRTENLFKQGRRATQNEMDEAVRTWIAAQKLHEEAQAELTELEVTDELTIAQAEARKAAQEQEVLRLVDMREKFTIRAPFAGYVVAKNTEVGEWIKEGDPLFEIIELERVEITIHVPEAYIARLQNGMEAARGPGRRYTADIQVGALPGKLFSGEVSRIVPQADLRTRSFPVKILVENPRTAVGHLLKSGMLARVALAVGKKRPALLLHKDALVFGGREPTVYVASTAKGQTTVRPVTVQLGASHGSLIEVRGQLKKKDKVVIEGNERLRPGQPVKILREVTTELKED